MTQEEKNEIRLRGELPDIIQAQLSKLGKSGVKVKESNIIELNEQLRQDQRKQEKESIYQDPELKEKREARQQKKAQRRAKQGGADVVDNTEE